MIENNFKRIVSEIHDTAIKCGRKPHEIEMVAVTKTVSCEAAQILYDLGQRNFAENRLQSAFEKMSVSPVDCRWHLIGTLQSNKARKAVGKFILIHSVDSYELASKLSQYSLEADVVTSILLQVNTSGEQSKHGMTTEKCQSQMEMFAQLPGISVQGLMTMAPLVADEKMIRTCFADLRLLRDSLATAELPLPHLSMGMSNDYKLAIAEGATLLRIGTALFK